MTNDSHDVWAKPVHFDKFDQLTVHIVTSLQKYILVQLNTDFVFVCQKSI